MSFLNDLRITRKKFLDGLEANQEDIDMSIFEDFYPDRAHFIYELLQNAEDANASNVRFVLSERSLVCEHDGRPFNEADVRAITGIGTGTKKDDDDKIGRFGIGFKAALVYTDTPRIWSPTFAFEISNMVLPMELEPNPALGNQTRFEFPFKSSKKPAPDAFSEVKAGLEELSANTLLFLSNIESIDWQVEGEAEARLLRVLHSKHHLETLKESNDKATRSSHFLRFTSPIPIEGLEKQYAAVAFELFELEPPPSGRSSNANVPLAKRFQIVPAKPGRVAVYFDCAKETSGLRFHLHAPFVPELSRASVKDTPTNEPLFRRLAMLTANSLSIIRDLGLLNRDFLAVLPNKHDEIPARYTCVREAVIEAMNEQPLTPTHSGGHAPANRLLQAGRNLKSLLSAKDIAILRDSEGIKENWAVGTTQRNNDVDFLLRSLDIEEWDVEQLVEVLEERLGLWDDDPDARLIEWLRSKSGKWHQKLYALLQEFGDRTRHQVWDLPIVRLSTGEYRVGNDCYFPTDEGQEDPDLPPVARDTYTSGRTKTEQSAARKFLEVAGVGEVGEYERVKAILEGRYSSETKRPGWRIHKQDLQRFIALAKDRPQTWTAETFSKYSIFIGENDVLIRPKQAYLDSPYLKTGLRVFFNALNDDDGNYPVALTDHYLKYRIPKEQLVAFAKDTGVQTKLVPIKLETQSHRYRFRLHQDRRTGVRVNRNTKIDRDWTIRNLRPALECPSEDISRLIWNTMRREGRNILQAEYRPNQKYTPRIEPSTLVLTLRELPWIPQQNGKFVRPAEASKDQLPEGFTFDHGWPWLKEIRFGEESAKRDEEYRRTRALITELGFKNDDAFNDAKRFAELPPETRRQILTEQETEIIAELPNRQPGNPDRRKDRVRLEAENAPGRKTSIRIYSISEHWKEVKQETRTYLCNQYTKDGVMICQVCKKALPFKLDDVNYYFVAVEFLPTLKRRHYQNYLALCPNHAAMYVHANGSEELMKELFLDLEGNELKVVLAKKDNTIHFNETHVLDLKAVIEGDSSDR